MLLACILITALGGPLVAGALGARAGIAPGSSPSSARQDKPTVYRPGGDVKPPRLVREVKPQYTPEAMEARIQGTLWLEAVVLDTGEVGDVEVTRSLDTVYGMRRRGRLGHEAVALRARHEGRQAGRRTD